MIHLPASQKQDKYHARARQLSVLLPIQQTLLVSPHPLDTEHKPCQCGQLLQCVTVGITYVDLSPGPSRNTWLIHACLRNGQLTAKPRCLAEYRRDYLRGIQVPDFGFGNADES